MSDSGYLKQWEALLAEQDESTFEKFWKEYSDADISLYTAILSDKKLSMSGKFAELAEQYGIGKVIFMGFLDGIKTRLKKPLKDLDDMADDAEISLKIDPELLYHNMLIAEAEHLFTLPV